MQTVIIITVIIIGFIALYFSITSFLRKQENEDKLEDTVNKVFGLASSKIAQQSKQILESEKEVIKTDLDNKQQIFEKLVKDLNKELSKSQNEIRDLEKDRIRKFSELNNSLQEHRKIADELKVSTQQLSKVLSNNQARGQWGERIIEDILEASGLMEGVHYLKQQKQSSSNLRPDITLLLPNKRNVPVDVKFPYSEIQKLSSATTKKAKKAHLKQFSKDIKSKINKVANYISPEHNTLDYAILFVPNEMVFSFFNQKFPDLADYAISKRVLIVSPFTFLIVAHTVRESYRNFMIGDQLKEVIKHVEEFVTEWDRFKDQFAKFGRSIKTIQRDYDSITQTRTRQMEKRIRNVRQISSGVNALSQDQLEAKLNED